MKEKDREKKEHEFSCQKCDKKYKIKVSDYRLNRNKYKKHCSSKCANSRTWTEKQKREKSETQSKILNKNNLTLKEFTTQVVKWKQEKLSWKEMTLKLGVKRGTLFKLLRKINLFDSNYGLEILKKDKTKPFVYDELRSETNIRRVKRQIKKHNLIDYSRCSKCKLSSWEGESINLELDHIDGNRQNNEIENLRYLCPNCHSQTKTFRSKNKKHGRKITDEDFVIALQNSKSINEAFKRLNIPSVVTHYKRALKLIENHNIKMFT